MKSSNKASILIMTLVTIFLIQCSGSGSNEVIDNLPIDDLEPNPSCTDPIQAQAFLKARYTSINVNANTDEEQAQDIVVCNTPGDKDGDTILDENDNCSDQWNFSQLDSDEDGIGDSCDNCPEHSNADQLDNDNDGQGNTCDLDLDNDGTDDSIDNCPGVPNTDQANADGDAAGDVCDDQPHDASLINDHDKDGVSNEEDNCPSTPNGFLNADGSYTYITDFQWDMDGDGQGDACDDDIDGDLRINDIDDCDYNILANCSGADTDNDGIPDTYDNCDNHFNPGQEDADDDDIGDACDATSGSGPSGGSGSGGTIVDTDGDGIADSDDNCPNNYNVQQNDNDGDGHGNTCDNCRDDANVNQSDKDADGLGNVCDDDLDGDGLANEVDNCSFSQTWYLVPSEWRYDNNGVVDTDGIIDRDEMLNATNLVQLWFGKLFEYVPRSGSDFLENSDLTKAANYDTEYTYGGAPLVPSTLPATSFDGTFQETDCP